MSGSDYLGGWLLLAATVLPAAGLAWVILRRWLGHLDRVEAGVAGALLGLTAWVAIHQLPLMLGLLSQGTVLAAAALCAGTALALHLRRPVPGPGAHRPRPEAPGAGALARALAALTLAASLVVLVAEARAWLSRGLIGVDTLTFHLPNVARWLQSGSLWQVDQFIPLQAQGYYPNTGDVVLLGMVLPWHSDFLVRAPMLLLLPASGVAIVATARELGAPRPVAVSVAAALASMPIVVAATIPRAMPDVLLLFALAAAGLFGLRHARTARRSDLVLCGIGLGLALGTKWYGLPAAGVGVLAIAAGGLLRREGLARAAGAGATAGGAAFVVGGVWMVRNLVGVGNPLFPLHLAPLGITLLSAPRDVVADQVGFSILDYVGNPHVLFGSLPKAIQAGTGWAPLLLLGGLAVGALLAARRGAAPRPAALGVSADGRPGGGRVSALTLGGGRDGRILALAVAAVALTLLYAQTPYSALGLKGAPGGATFNTRYWLPGLLCAGWVAAWAAGRLPRTGVVLQLGLLIATLLALESQLGPVDAKALVAASVLLALVAGAVLLVRRTARRPRAVPRPVRLALSALGTIVLLVAALGYGHRIERNVDADRFRDDPVGVEIAERSRDQGPLRVAIAGDWNPAGISPVWVSFGPRVRNRVTVLGTFARGLLTNYATAPAFTARLHAVEPDLLVVGNGLAPVPGQPVREERWAAADGYRVLTRTDRLTLMARPAQAG